ncbi:acylphosphatase [Parastagonospora nodorum]|uniref:acylphosphatase n=2 Tax=Phaeosphaeria nodorum (strain SN15 / ATCC MYA-4574 / FGSC 10173) TaxID=321614 RepID=A0A7U2EYS2_PHANO|nr:acylphosphatase [Parastagonospora nodorum]QRC95331.1 acylphosphatase [Parastagonospora nodorum SN15]KAH3937340.1 acylphosphatase [Parastagonospora nodorum]KAH3953763.1 acylphosphatase [Parastagonospora nodorum]KAH4006889.1 acylphosphatase [Parastagonospora nodorum]
MKRIFSTTAKMSTKRISYTVKGEVQGVNFRSFTQKQARSIGVTGFVTNASDGSVQGEAQGSDDAIKQFVQHLNKGPPAASVSSVKHDDISTKSGESSFNVP